MMRLACMALMAMALLFGSREAAAQTCTVTAPDVYFGSVSVPLPQTDVSMPLNISCAGGSPGKNLNVCIGIQPSNYFLGIRRMFRGIFSSLPYQLYFDPGRSVVWDETPYRLVQVPLGTSGSGSATTTVYARMPSGGSPAAGMYNSAISDDTLVGAIKSKSDCSGGSSGNFIGDAFDVSVFVGGNCQITADPINFGTVFGSIDAAIDVKGAVHASCNNELPYSIALNAGQVPGNTIANRRLGLNGAGPGMIDYQLYLDFARTQLWGDGTVGALYNGTGNGATQDIDVYGRVPAGQAVTSGTYKDTVTATITF